MQWPETWGSLEENDESRALMEKVLLREVAPGHPLYGVPVQALGRNYAADDVLYRLLDGSGRVADVHLTWARGPERPPWPHTLLYDSVEAWLAAQKEDWE